MGANSEIAWTDHSFNPWWGCTKVSPGCEHCYADTFAKRVGHGGRLPVIWGPKAERKIASEAVWREPVKWNRAAEKAGVRARVFCASMADVFEDREDLVAPRARLAALVRATPSLDWLLLTKRPENAARLWAGAWADAWNGADSLGFEWAPNIWLGTTCEDQRRADERIPHLLAVPSAVRFLSVEPMLEAIDLARTGAFGCTCEDDVRCSGACSFYRYAADKRRRIDWCIVGGESGPGARAFDLAWARSVVRQCREAGTKVFVKQLGARVVTDGFSPAGAWWPEGTAKHVDTGLGIWRVPLRHPKGGDMAEWPADLRVREFPRSALVARNGEVG